MKNVIIPKHFYEWDAFFQSSTYATVFGNSSPQIVGHFPLQPFFSNNFPQIKLDIFPCLVNETFMKGQTASHWSIFLKHFHYMRSDSSV